MNSYPACIRIVAILIIPVSPHDSVDHVCDGPKVNGGHGGASLLQHSFAKHRAVVLTKSTMHDRDWVAQASSSTKGGLAQAQPYRVLHRPRSLTRALSRPIFHVAANLTRELVSHGSHNRSGPSQDKGPLFFVVYHKTGTIFSRSFLSVLRDGEPRLGARPPCGKRISFCPNLALLRNTTDVLYNIQSSKGSWLGMSQHWSLGALEYNKPLPGFYKDSRELYPRTDFFLVVKPSPMWNPASGGKVVHWVRDPVDMIASAYRYLSEGREPWMLHPMHCNYCNKLALEILFDTCKGFIAKRRCSFRNVVRRVNETEGVLYTAMVLQRQLQDMADNLMRWTTPDSTALHLSVQALSNDFDGALTCLLRFAGIKGARQRVLLRKAQWLDLHRRKAHASKKHATAGRYDNAAIKDFLRSQPVWGAQFAELATAMRNVSLSQSRFYGCPSIV